MNLKKVMKHWKVGAIESQLWSDQAQRASVLIETDGEAARAVLVDDYAGVRDVFKVPTGQIGEVIAAATQAWLKRGTGGSLAVYTTELKTRGGISPPPPPPPPGPGGHERIFMKQMVAGHVTFDVAAEFAHLDEIGGLEQVDLELKR